MIKDLLYKLKIIFLLLRKKEYYIIIVTDRYEDGKELCSEVFGYGRDTITWRRKLIKSLKEDIRGIENNNKRI